jgi:hypothetical protein
MEATLIVKEALHIYLDPVDIDALYEIVKPRKVDAIA